MTCVLQRFGSVTGILMTFRPSWSETAQPVYFFDLGTGQWEQFPDLPVKEAIPSFAKDGEELYLFLYES